MTSWLVIFRAFFFFFFSEFFGFFFPYYLQKNSKTSKVIFKYFIIFLKIQDNHFLTVSLSKKNTQTEPQKNIFFFNQTINI